MFKKKVIALLLGAALVASMITGCGGAAGTSSDSGKSTGGKKVGVSMPTKDLQRWNQDGDNMKKEFEAAGYEVDLQYASNDVQTQLSQVENMISSGCNVLVIAAIEGSSLGEALDMAKEKGVPVIAYDRLLMDSDAVSYYATFDNYMVGTVQGTYVKDTLDLDNAEGPFNIEFTAGDPGDNNAGFFFNGAYDVLKPYIESGKLNVVSGQKTFEEVATPAWATETAQSRAENILSSNYADGKNVDVWLCSNDSTALGVETALANNYNGTYPIITGQDCDIENTKNMIAGKQSMSVFKDTRTLASQVVKMVGQILNNETVDVNDTTTYNNNKITVPSYLCEPVFADANNYKEILIDSGYYTEDDLK
ncbi:MAG: sugar-binding protein [Eubacterium sp.]|nr:sugar-binding protein [Eubacterium sp.]